MRQLSWYLTRIRIMDGKELLHRVFEQGWLVWIRIRYWVSSDPSVPDPLSLRFCRGSEPQVPTPEWPIPVTAPVQAGLRCWPALGFPWAWSKEEGVWQRAPDTGRKWPRKFFGAIPYRHGNPYGDARVVWEPSRLQQLVWLARMADRAEGEQADAAVDLVRAQLVDWVESNPPWTGVHYISAMECGLRVISVCHALDMLRTWFAARDPVWASVTALVASHSPFIAKRISRFSSATNHTVAEAAGLVYAGVLFPELNEAQAWLADGLDILRKEADRQVLPDGGGIEQSLHYHRFVLELLALVERLLRHHRIPVPQELVEAGNRGALFLSHMRDVGNQMPSIGDCDSGYALSPDLAILGCDRPTSPYIKHFEHTGYTVIHYPSPDAAHIVLDHGPFGMPPAYGHAHCDALALSMSVAGVPQLLDPGTYTYTGEKRWRTYFRSSRAHNTVTVNGRDAANQETAFQWSRTFRATLIHKEIGAGGRIRLLACHRGYARDGVTYWRYVTVFARPVVVAVLDVLHGADEHALELNWHMPAETQAEAEGVFRAEHLSIVVNGGRSNLVLGDATEDPRAWCSTMYGRLEPAACVSTHYKGELPHEFTTVCFINDIVLDRLVIEREFARGRQWVAAFAISNCGGPARSVHPLGQKEV